MFIRYTNKCLMCDKSYYEPIKAGCVYPSKVCDDCRLYYERAKTVSARLKQNVDLKFFRKLLEKDCCEYCGKKLKLKEREVEHKTPINKGGDNSNANLCISCKQCNLEKKERTYEEYLEWRKGKEVTQSDIKLTFDLLSTLPLFESKTFTEYSLEFRSLRSPIEKHESVKDDKGRIIGYRKLIYTKRVWAVTKEITKTSLTKYGITYNNLCKKYKKNKMLKESVTEKILNSELMAYMF